MRNLLAKQLEIYFKKNKHSYLLTGDLGYSVFDNFRKKYKKKFINVGVSEQNMIGIAAGLSINKNKVFVYSMSNFGILRCFEQIRNDIVFHNLNVKIACVGGGFAYGNHGYTHLGVEDIGAISLFEDQFLILVPSCKKELLKVFPRFANSRKPTYLRLWRNNEDDINYDITLKYYSQINELTKTVIITVGPVAKEIEKLRKLKICHINFFQLNNIPKKIFIELFSNFKIKNLIFIEEHTMSGSFSSYYLKKCMEYSMIPKKCYNYHFSLKNYKKHGSHDFLRLKSKMNSTSIYNELKKNKLI